MNSEQNLPEASAPQAPPPASHDEQQNNQAAPGEGTSRSSRRRRRRRKNKLVTPPATGEQQPNGAAPAPTAAASQPTPNGQNQAGTVSGKRWKKKNRRRERDRQRPQGEQNPGNSIYENNSGGGYSNSSSSGNGFNRRKSKQKGPRSFVGPMDHSYREVNGNYAETSPSTIEVQGNVRQHSSRKHHFDRDADYLPPELRSNAVSIPIAEDAPTHIYFCIDDLFLIAKINETARKLGVKIAFLKKDSDPVKQLAALEEHDRPALVVFDLNSTSTKPLTVIPKIRTKFKRSISIIGFLSVLQGELKAKATEVGCDTVMPRSAFSQNLPNLLRRYGSDEKEEPNFNQ